MRIAKTLLLVVALIFTVSESFGNHFLEEGNQGQGEGQQPPPPPQQPNPLGFPPPPPLPPIAPGRPTFSPRFGGARRESPRVFLLPPADQDKQIDQLEEKLKTELHKLIVQMRGLPREELAALNLDGIEELKKIDRVFALDKSVSTKDGKALSSTGKAHALLNALLLTQFARNVIGAGLGKDEAATKTLRALAFDSALKDYQVAEAKIFGAIKEGMLKPTQTAEDAVVGIRGIEVKPQPAPQPVPFLGKPPQTAGDILSGSYSQSLAEGPQPKTVGDYINRKNQPLSTAGGSRRTTDSPKPKITPSAKSIN